MGMAICISARVSSFMSAKTLPVTCCLPHSSRALGGTFSSCSKDSRSVLLNSPRLPSTGIWINAGIKSKSSLNGNFCPLLIIVTVMKYYDTPYNPYTCMHHRIQLAVGDMTMGGWKPTISLIHPPTHISPKPWDNLDRWDQHSCWHLEYFHVVEQNWKFGCLVFSSF